jgi:hypothetical protein
VGKKYLTGTIEESGSSVVSSGSGFHLVLPYMITMVYFVIPGRNSQPIRWNIEGEIHRKIFFKFLVYSVYCVRK